MQLGEPQSRSLKFQLSVSSVGSEAMQPPPPGGRSSRTTPFQYPRSDRRRCNSALAIVRSGTIHPTFSILGRIGGDATEVAQRIRETSQVRFQYPRSDRRRCNRDHPLIAIPRLVPFQYPRSDRRRCNSAEASASDPSPTLSVSSVGSEAMQLPVWGDSTLPAPCLSVSSVGSEAMQPLLVGGVAVLILLSVSSVGSEAMQPTTPS